MIYYQKRINETKGGYEYEYNKYVNEIIDFDFDLKYVGDFYPIENENGNGMIVKMNTGTGKLTSNEKGDEYQICGKECKCIVECEINNDCGEGMDCVKYECVKDAKIRKETRIGRKNMESVIILPMVIVGCMFGVFTSMYYAQQYGNIYFSEKCKESCPSNSEDVKVETETKVINNRKRFYECSGFCKLNYDRYEKQVSEKVSPMTHEFDWDEDDYPNNNEFEKEVMQNTLELIINLSSGDVKNVCESKKVTNNLICVSKDEAENVFRPMAQVECERVDYDWKNYKNSFEALQTWGEMKNVCDVNVVSVVCTEVVLD